MVIIYSTLQLGGIETFFVRMAEKRHAQKKPTTLLLLSPPDAGNQALIERIGKVATVLFMGDVMRMPQIFRKMPLIAPLQDSNLRPIIERCEHIHVSDGSHALFARRLLQRYAQKGATTAASPAISVGFYHYIKFAWGKWEVPYYERKHREFVLRYLPKPALCLYSEDTLKFYQQYMGEDLTGANTFRLGVVDPSSPAVSGHITEPLRICAVGRLVPFKAYNLYMLDLVSDFKAQGQRIHFDVYGTGPLHEQMVAKIKTLGLEQDVTLHGDLNYAQFDEVVSQADIFIGSGTAIIQAASLGVACIVGVESVKTPVSYGFFNQVYHREYNLKGLELETVPVKNLIAQFINMSEDQREALRSGHLAAMGEFSNQGCADALDSIRVHSCDLDSFKFSLIRYELSRAVDKIHARLSRSHPQHAWVEEEL